MASTPIHLPPTGLTQQPQFIAAIDWSNPITRGLVFCAVPSGNTFLDIVTGVIGTPTGSLTPSVRSPGSGLSRDTGSRAVAGTGNGTDQVIWPVSPLRGASLVNTGTLLALGGTIEQVDGNQYPMGGNCDGLVTGNGFSLLIDSFAVFNRGNILKGNYLGAIDGSSTPLLGNPFDNRTYFFGYSFNSNGASGAWLSGGVATAFSGLSTHGTTTTNRQAAVLSPSVTGTTTRSGYVSLFLMWDREITPQEYSALYDNPWQLFQGQLQEIWVPAAGGVTINATPGAYTWSGKTATTSQLISGIIGPYTWSGTTSNVVAVVYATPGLYTWSGTTATTTQLILSTPGAYTWSGTTATTSQLITATTGAYTWSGTTSVFASDINATPGTYTWSGTTATTSQFINAIPGVYTWSGTNSTLSGAINATPGAYTWSGTTSGTIQLINASPGAYSWAGTTSTTSQAITSIVGVWSWAGTTSEIVAAITASPGAYTWSGTTSALFNAVNAMPGLWSWNGTTATTIQLVSQITGIYLWSGTTSGVIIPVVLPISPGAWSWAGTISTVPLPIRGAFVSTSDWTVVNQGNPPVTRRIQISGFIMACCSFPTLIVSLVGSANGDSIRTMFGSWTATTNQTSTDSSWSAPDNAVLLSKAGYWKISVHGSATITSSASSVLNAYGTFIPEAIVNDTISQYYRPNPLSFSTAGKDPHWHDEFYVLSSGSTLAHIFMYDEAYASSSPVTFTGTVTAQLCTP